LSILRPENARKVRPRRGEFVGNWKIRLVDGQTSERRIDSPLFSQKHGGKTAVTETGKATERAGTARAKYRNRARPAKKGWAMRRIKAESHAMEGRLAKHTRKTYYWHITRSRESEQRIDSPLFSQCFITKDRFAA